MLVAVVGAAILDVEPELEVVDFGAVSFAMLVSMFAVFVIFAAVEVCSSVEVSGICAAVVVVVVVVVLVLVVVD